jgi:hypothetical protein
VGWPAWIWERDGRRKPGLDSSGPTTAAHVGAVTLLEASLRRSRLRIQFFRGNPRSGLSGLDVVGIMSFIPLEGFV